MNIKPRTLISLVISFVALGIGLATGSSLLIVAGVFGIVFDVIQAVPQREHRKAGERPR